VGKRLAAKALQHFREKVGGVSASGENKRSNANPSTAVHGSPKSGDRPIVIASQARKTRCTVHFSRNQACASQGVQAAKNLHFGGCMRNLLLFSVLLLGASWMAAQTTTQSQTATGTQKTVTGCLSQANGQYMLTSRKGTTYELTGDSSVLANHVGHEIRVTGTESGAGASANAGTGDASANGPTIEVSSVKHISKTCSTSGAGGMSH
jgi:hypothetical protein